jgi:hypothetical protein
MYFDDQADGAVRDLWRRLAEAGGSVTLLT